MGDDLSLEERMSVRTPMQWSDEPNGGFSRAEPGDLVRPAIDEGPFRYAEVNVAAQRRDEDSLLRWIERLASVRMDCREIGWGTAEVVPTDEPAVFAHRCTWRGGAVLAVHNLGPEGCTVKLDLDLDGVETIVDLLAHRDIDAAAPLRLDLAPYGYRWFRLRGAGPDRGPDRAAHVPIDLTNKNPS